MQIAAEKFSEATVGYRENRVIAVKWTHLFSTPYFIVSPVSPMHVYIYLICIQQHVGSGIVLKHSNIILNLYEKLHLPNTRGKYLVNSVKHGHLSFAMNVNIKNIFVVSICKN